MDVYDIIVNVYLYADLTTHYLRVVDKFFSQQVAFCTHICNCGDPKQEWDYKKLG